MHKTLNKIYGLCDLLRELKKPDHKLNYPNLHEKAWELFRGNCEVLEKELEELKKEMSKK